MSKILKNQTGSDVDIPDMGLTIPASGNLTIDTVDYSLLASSNDVITLLGNVTLKYNDGTSDLNISDSLDHIKNIFPSKITTIKGDSVLTWAEMKIFADTRKISIQYIDRTIKYELTAFDSSFSVTCTIIKDADPASDSTDFETNYKMTKCNKTPSIASPFNAKVLDGKKLYTRAHGFRKALIAGPNTFTYLVPYMMAKLDGMEITDGESGDYLDLYIVDTDGSNTPPYYQVNNQVLNQFGFERNIAKDFYALKSKYDSDLKKDMRIRLVYNSVSAKTIGVNPDLHEVKD